MSESQNSTRPTTVTAAFWLWVAATVVSAIGGIMILATAGEAPAIQQLEGAERDAASAAIVGIGVVSIIFAALRVLFAWFMYQGRNWARILLTVLGVLTVFSVLLQAGSVGILEWISAALVAIATVLMYVPASNGYFTASRRARS